MSLCVTVSDPSYRHPVATFCSENISVVPRLDFNFLNFSVEGSPFQFTEEDKHVGGEFAISLKLFFPTAFVRKSLLTP